MQTQMLRPYISELKRVLLGLEDLADLNDLKLSKGTAEFTKKTMLEAAERLTKVASLIEKAATDETAQGG